MTKSNRMKVHRVDSNSAWKTGCGKRRPRYDYDRREQTTTVNDDAWSALPPSAQCTRCRRGTWARWATEEEIAAVECGLIGLVAVFALPCKEWRTERRIFLDSIVDEAERQGISGPALRRLEWSAL